MSHLLILAAVLELAGWKGETVSFRLDHVSAREGAFSPRWESAPAGWEVHAGVMRGVRYLTEAHGADYGFAPDRVEWCGTTNLPPNGRCVAVGQVKIPADAKAGDYELAFCGRAVRLTVVDRTLPPAKEWKGFTSGYWHHPWALARTSGTRLWSKEHFDAMRPFLAYTAALGVRTIMCTICDLPWNHQCYDPNRTMVRHVMRGGKYGLEHGGRWTFDYSVFDKWVEFCLETGNGPYIYCYALCPWDYELWYHDESGRPWHFNARPGTKEYEAYWAPFLVDFRRHLKEKGWFERTYLAADERDPGDVRAYLDLLRRVAPDFRVNASGNGDPETYRGVELGAYDQILTTIDDAFLERARRMVADGRKVLYYVCCSPTTPNTFIGSDPDDAFWLPVFAAAKGLSGFSRWTFDSFPENAMEDASYACWPSGDTFFAYPNGDPSWRYLNLLNGYQHAEKWRILEAEGGAVGAELKMLGRRYDVRQALHKKDGDFTKLIADTKEVLNGQRRKEGMPCVAEACAADRPPAGAEVLFDGTSLERWRSMDGGPATWHIQPDGTMLVDKTGNTPNKVIASLYTRDVYTNFQMHLEYRIPADIDRTDRFRGNSGVKIFGCYEVQIIDGFENPDLKPTQMCGAIYANAAPMTNACTAPGTWQSLDIVFRAPVLRPGGMPCRAAITVKHNGVLVQDATRPPPYPENPETLARTCGTIELQSHNDDSKCLSFRNVWIRRIADGEAVDVSAAEFEAKRAALLARPRTLLTDNDGNDFVYYSRKREVSEKAFIDSRIGFVARTRCETMIYCPWSAGFGYFTVPEIGDTYTNACPYLDTYNPIKDFLAIGKEPLQMAIDFCRRENREIFLGLRWNDTHDSAYDQLFPPWKAAHSNCLFGTKQNRLRFSGWSAVDFGHAEARDYLKDFFRKFLARYDLDGVEIDFFRHLCTFGSIARAQTQEESCATPEQLGILSDLMRDLRAIAEEEGRRRGKPFAIAIRVPDSFDYCRALGIDLERWLKEKYVDIVIGGGYFQLNPWRVTAARVHALGAKFYASMDESRIGWNKRAYPFGLLPGREGLPFYAARLAAAVADGADGSCFFNCQGGTLAAFGAIDATATEGISKRYFAVERGSSGSLPYFAIYMGRRFSTLPKLDPAYSQILYDHDVAQIPLVIGDDFTKPMKKAPKAVANVLVDMTERPDLRLRANGRSLARPSFRSDNSTNGVFTVDVPVSVLKRGENLFEVEMVDSRRVQGVRLVDFRLDVNY